MQGTGESGFGTVKFTGRKAFGCELVRSFNKKFSYKLHHGFPAIPQHLSRLPRWAKHISDALHRAANLFMSLS